MTAADPSPTVVEAVADLQAQLARRLEAIRASATELEATNRLEGRAIEWVEEHGSTRLRKAVKAGLLKSAMGIYRDERLASEHPGWMCVVQRDAKTFKEALNPPEEALDGLASLRVGFWNTPPRLRFHPDGLVVLVATFEGREVWTPAVGDLDEIESWVGYRESLSAAVSEFVARGYVYGDEEPF